MGNLLLEWWGTWGAAQDREGARPWPVTRAEEQGRDAASVGWKRLCRPGPKESQQPTKNGGK